MWSFNGIGTMHLGVKAAEEPGTFYATVWFTIVGFPILPLRREHVIFGSVVSGGSSESQEYQVLTWVPVCWSNVLITYVLACVVFLKLMLWRRSWMSGTGSWLTQHGLSSASVTVSNLDICEKPSLFRPPTVAGLWGATCPS